MNFFKQQDQAKKQSRWLIFMFILAVLAIVVAIDLVLLLALGLSNVDPAQGIVSGTTLVANNIPLLTGGGIATVSVVGLASLAKTAGLRSGGGKIARDLGGTLVESDTRDLKRRRLRNVVEEIALASGVPVPEIYVLDQELGINAFAAGYSPSDAAVAVTRGALDTLSRDELQGVIAHEFSHILNGDMRINIRLMGALFGILILALIGRRVLMHSSLMGRSRDKGGAAVLAVAFGLMAVGYIGLFFGRWIKAAVSRQREYLADASAVQFTRDPSGIGGALKKIAVYNNASFLRADTEEISHMLFGDGQKMLMFSTHPPLLERIGRIDPSFRPEDLDVMRARMARDARRKAKERARKQAKVGERAGGMFDADRIIDSIGQPAQEGMLIAAAIAASVPSVVMQSAHSTEWAPEVLFYTLLDSDPAIREQQLLIIAEQMGADSESQVRALEGAGPPLQPEQRLPLLEVAFPALKRRPPEFVAQVLETVQLLITADGRIDVFEYLLARVISQHLWESQNPQAVKTSGSKSLKINRTEIADVLAILAGHGHAEHDKAESAFRKGMSILWEGDNTPMPAVENWVTTLDEALAKLDRLRSMEKEKLVRAMIEVVLLDGELVASELELLRVVCDLIHVPLPIFSSGTNH
jgi:Zn-dependent protease with chaperone function